MKAEEYNLFFNQQSYELKLIVHFKIIQNYYFIYIIKTIM